MYCKEWSNAFMITGTFIVYLLRVKRLSGEAMAGLPPTCGVGVRVHEYVHIQQLNIKLFQPLAGTS